MSDERRTELMETGYGQNGGILLTDTTAITGNFTMMVVLETSTFTTLTTRYTLNDATTASTGADWGTLYEGAIISGDITAVTLATGKVLLVR